MKSCQYAEARRGHMSGGERCPACGVVAEQHVRECDVCGCDISADMVESCKLDGKLLCDLCARNHA